MSWGYEKTGTPEALAKDVDTSFDRMAANYAGQPEADDIAACKARALALLSALDMTPDLYTAWNAATVKAGGSHSASGGKVQSASFSLSVVRTALAL